MIDFFFQSHTGPYFLSVITVRLETRPLTLNNQHSQISGLWHVQLTTRSRCQTFLASLFIRNLLVLISAFLFLFFFFYHSKYTKCSELNLLPFHNLLLHRSGSDWNLSVLQDHRRLVSETDQYSCDGLLCFGVCKCALNSTLTLHIF